MAIKDSIVNLKKELRTTLTNVPALIDTLVRGLDGVAAEITPDTAAAHNSIYRGKYLGSEVTTEQYATIEAGTFEDLYIGDYWTINSINWRIAHFDYWLGTGDTETTTHHIVIVPDQILYKHAMNTENTAEGGYYGSAMRGGENYLIENSSGLYQASEAVKAAFNASHILTHRINITNAIYASAASAVAWTDSIVDLMSEQQIMGSPTWSIAGKGYEIGVDKTQFALFAINPDLITNREIYWTRSIYSANGFATIYGYGNSYFSFSTYEAGVRPVFALKGNTSENTSRKTIIVNEK